MLGPKRAAPRSRLDSFLREAPFSAGKLARAADMPVQHLSDLRAGRSEAKVSTVDRLVRAAERLLGRRVEIRDLFEIGHEASPGVAVGEEEGEA
jgi:hypothetical protein